MKPPPPMLPAVGWVTAMTNAVATAASIALPPSLITLKPICDAMSFWVMTIPSFARTGDDPACSERLDSARTVVRRRKARRVMRPPGADYSGLLGTHASKCAWHPAPWHLLFFCRLRPLGGALATGVGAACPSPLPRGTGEGGLALGASAVEY